MNHYQKIAFVVLRAEAYLTMLYALREFAAVTIYVPAKYFSLLPTFFVNVGYSIFWGCLSLAAGLLVLAISRPLATIIGGALEGED